MVISLQEHLQNLFIVTSFSVYCFLCRRKLDCNLSLTSLFSFPKVDKNRAFLNLRCFYTFSYFLIAELCLEKQFRLGFSYFVKRHFQQYFSYIVTVSFIGGGNRSTQRKPSTCHKPLTNITSHNVVSSTPHHERDSLSQRKW